MQDTFTFCHTVDIQRSILVALRHDFETLPLDSASYQVHTGQLQRAIETLEQGRALVWPEMCGLRSSIEQFHASGFNSGDKFCCREPGPRGVDLDSRTRERQRVSPSRR